MEKLRNHLYFFLKKKLEYEMDRNQKLRAYLDSPLCSLVNGIIQLTKETYRRTRVLQSTAREIDPTTIKFGELFKIVK